MKPSRRLSTNLDTMVQWRAIRNPFVESRRGIPSGNAPETRPHQNRNEEQ